MRRIVDHAAPADVAAHDADDAIVDGLVVHDHLRAGLEQTVELRVERLQPHAQIVDAGERSMQVRQAELVVVVQVVRRRDDADHAAEPVLAQPDDLLLATDATMVVAVPAGTLADRQLVFHEPREVARRDAERPLPAQPGWHQPSLHVCASELCGQVTRSAERFLEAENESLLMPR